LAVQPYETPSAPEAFVLDGTTDAGGKVRLHPGPLWAPQTRAVRLGEPEDDLGGRRLTVWLLPGDRMLLVSESGEGREAMLLQVQGTEGAAIFGPFWRTPRESGFPYAVAPEDGRGVTFQATVQAVAREGTEARAFPEPGQTRELVLWFVPGGLIFQGMPLLRDPEADRTRMEELLGRLLTTQP
ncbi:MAG: hypothetical protein AB7D57_14025, partial [Desulfovibrionaceae bacterium]